MADAERQPRKLAQPPLQRVDVVEDLLDVRVRPSAAGFDLEELGERCLSALDASRCRRRAHQIGTDQQMRVCQQLPAAGQPAE